jgi:ABC-type phosphate/phosphonate transport system substrate-binding protein
MHGFLEALASGELDLGLEYASKYVEAIDRGLAVTVLAGAPVDSDPNDGGLQQSRPTCPGDGARCLSEGSNGD